MAIGEVIVHLCDIERLMRILMLALYAYEYGSLCFGYIYMLLFLLTRIL